jgi:hypothetical protein
MARPLESSLCVWDSEFWVICRDCRAVVAEALLRRYMMMSYAVAVDFEYQPNIRTCTAEFGSASCLRQRIKSQRSALFALTVALRVVNII